MKTDRQEITICNGAVEPNLEQRELILLPSIIEENPE